MKNAPALHVLILTVSSWLNRKQHNLVEYLLAENHVLREQLGDRRLRFTDAQRRRLARAGHLLGRKALRQITTLVTPDTILKWYRKLIANKYDGSSRRTPGRPSIDPVIRELLLAMAADNPRWGYSRLAGALLNLGHHVGRNTIKRILREHGVDPAPTRGKHGQWSTFLRAHWGAIAATDFFTVEVLTMRGLVRYFVLFVIDLKTRRVEATGIAQQPYDTWMQQMAKNLTDFVDGFLRGTRYLIHDRDPLFTARFREILLARGVKTVKLPAQSPNLNAYAERFVRSIRQECLNHVVPLGEQHLRQIVREYLVHYHTERNHQGLDNTIINPLPDLATRSGPVKRRKRLGGNLSYYYRDAA